MNDTQKKIAILLFSLGQKTSDAVMNSFNSLESESVMRHLQRLRNSPPTAEQMEQVLAEFDSHFQSAQTSNQQSPLPSQNPGPNADIHAESKSTQEQSHEPNENPGEKNVSNADSEFRFPSVTLSGNSIADLNQFHPRQIAIVLSAERPKVMALAIECLEQEKKIAVLNLIPQESQGQVLSLLISGHAIQPIVQERIIESVINSASQISCARPESDDSVETIAKMISNLPREKRNNILGLLKDKDKENSDKVRRAIFKFEDIVQYADKSIQRILSEIDKHNLIIALADSDEQVCDKVFSNLSKRAKESLKEEIELQGTPSHTEVDFSKHCIADIIADLEINNQLDMQPS